eukprot:6103453-Pleurochrysis_carterae.AAC.2
MPADTFNYRRHGSQCRLKAGRAWLHNADRSAVPCRAHTLFPRTRGWAFISHALFTAASLNYIDDN